MDFNKLRNQKGLTGVDVVIAITIISVTTIAILAIFVNLVSSAKKNTRMSAATRLATSILTNIDSMYYADVEKELCNLISGGYGGTHQDLTGTYSLKSYGNHFNVSPDPGYNTYLYVRDIRNTSDNGNSEDSGAVWNCSMVLEITVEVFYTELDKVEFKTVKKRELVDECNKPELSYLIGTQFVSGEQISYASWPTDTIKSLNQIQPIEWSKELNTYIKSSAASNTWYNYEMKEWAKVLVSTEDDINVFFDSNTGALLPEVFENTDANCAVFEWIPKCGRIVTDDPSDSNNFAFVYGSSDDAIRKFKMPVNGDNEGNNVRDFIFYGVRFLERDHSVNSNQVLGKKASCNTQLFPDGKTGAWLELVYGNLLSQTGNTSNGYLGAGIASALVHDTGIYDTDYGPPINHWGKEDM